MTSVWPPKMAHVFYPASRANAYWNKTLHFLPSHFFARRCSRKKVSPSPVRIVEQYQHITFPKNVAVLIMHPSISTHVSASTVIEPYSTPHR
jgi:hypothetical protein